MPVFLHTKACVASLLILGTVLVSGCSGSNSGSDTEAGSEIVIADEGMADEGLANQIIVEDDSGASVPNDDPITTAPDPALLDPVTPESITAEPIPLASTRVTFNITVPAYMSNALQVRLMWGTNEFQAEWVGDELWSAVGDFPTNAVDTLTVLFNDNNGGITVGSVERVLQTGSTDSQIVDISADQFDTERWDNDEDGISNLNELIAGSNVFGPPRILLFSETDGFRHDSIDTALNVVEELAISGGLQVDRAAFSAGVFTAETLSNYAAVVWVLTSGDVLDDAEQRAFENYIRAGGGFAGIHAASDTEYDWPWYGNLVGAYFESHPVIQTATQTVEDDAHASTAHLGATWVRTDEWYNFNQNPRERVNVLLNLEEASYSGGTMGADHPIAWFHEYDGGRSWYTGGGHTVESYSEPQFREHLLGGLSYAAGVLQ